MYEDLLNQIGLSKKEAKVYEALLNFGEATPQTLSKETKLNRITVYAVLDSLLDKKLVSKSIKKKKIHFQIENPNLLKELIRTNKEKVRQAEEGLDLILPNLVSVYNLAVHKPTVSYFEGVEGVKEVYLKILEEKKEILGYFLIDKKREKELGLGAFWKKYYRALEKKKIKERFIVADNPEGVAYKKDKKFKKVRQIRLVPEKNFPFDIEKNICGNKIALLSLKKGNLLATLIENDHVAQSEKLAFELAWESAEKYDKEISKRLGL